jgi:signal transduction histidine kinase
VRPRQRQGWRTALLASVLVACTSRGPATAGATVVCQTPGEDGPLGTQIARDPLGSIPALRRMLDASAADASGQPSPAHLYAMLADAYRITGDQTQGRIATDRGKAVLTGSDDEALRRRLLFDGLLMRANQGDTALASSEFEAASLRVPEDAPDAVCMLVNRGYLRQIMGRSREALSDLTRASRLARERGSESSRAIAAAMLSHLYAASGFPEEASQYAQEVMAYAADSADQRWLAEGQFRRGDVALLVQDYAGAEESFGKALALWKAIGFPADVQAAEQRLCATLARVPRRDDARDTCREAYRMALNIDAPPRAKAALGSLGELELRNGHPQEALGYLDRALAMNGVDMSRAREAEIYGLRGQARAQLGNFAGAFEDETRQLDWLQHSNLMASGLGQIAVTRAKFDAAIQEQQLLRASDAAKRAAQDASRHLLERSALMVGVLLVLGFAGVLLWVLRRRLSIERAARATEERIHTMSRVIGGISHDFNNQLTVLMQATGLLAMHRSLAGDAPAQKLLQAIRQAGAACAHVTAQLLSFSRQQNLKPEPVALGEFLTMLRSSLGHIAGAKVQVRCEVEEPEPVAFVDRRQLEAALLNLVGNARDALAEGGVVVIRAGRGAPDEVTIAVVDQGCGMPPDVLARATEPFFTTKPVGGGSGLGLSMVHGFATQSGGTLKLSSEPDVGTCAQLTLPAARSERNQPSVSATRSS